MRAPLGIRLSRSILNQSEFARRAHGTKGPTSTQAREASESRPLTAGAFSDGLETSFEWVGTAIHLKSTHTRQLGSFSSS